MIYREQLMFIGGNNNFGFELIEATGRSGGLITISDDEVFIVSDSIKSRYFFITFGRWVGINTKIAIVNVYAPQAPSEKMRTWEKLAHIKSSRVAIWIFAGDFNVVCRRDEQVNSRFCHISADDFNEFILSYALHDLRMGGYKFTYFRPEDGGKLSKLDRFLVCDNFMECFPGSSVTALAREFSDHCPIMLKTSCEDFGPRPFRFFNSWMLKAGFQDVVSEAWRKFRGYGNGDAFLAAKLRFLKKEIKK